MHTKTRRVIMRTSSAGPEGVRSTGQIVEVSADDARALTAGHYASPVDEPECAAIEPREKATLPRPRARR